MSWSKNNRLSKLMQQSLRRFSKAHSTPPHENVPKQDTENIPDVQSVSEVQSKEKSVSTKGTCFYYA